MMPRPTYRRATVVCIASVAMLWLPTGAFALSVGEDVIWGFDNHVVPGRMNPVFIRVFNDRPVPFDGTIHLYGAGNVGGRIGVTSAQECYVTPFTERWLQFSVYVGHFWGEWALTWGKGAFDGETLNEPRRGPPARVFLTVADQGGARGVKIQTFPSSLLPADVSSMERLHSVALDAAPHWEPARRQAFLQWIRGGGIVHLLKDGNGRYPQFGDDLEVLNRENSRYNIGSGMIVRHLITRHDFTDAHLSDRGFLKPEIKDDGQVLIHNLESMLFGYLRSQVRANHRWKPILILMLIYIGMVGPANGFVARKWKTTRWATLSFFGIVVLFSVAFSAVGRHGFKDSASTRAVAVARSTGDGTYDVTQWYSVFVVRSGTYVVRHASGHNAYATCDGMSTANGVARGGLDGALSIKIPLNSSATFLHRGTAKADDFGIRLADGNNRTGDSTTLVGRTFEIGEKFPDKTMAMWAYHQGLYYKLSRDDQRLSVGEPVDGAKFLTHQEVSRITRHHFRRRRPGQEENTSEMRTHADALARVLIARSVGQADVFRNVVSTDSFGPRRVRIFVMTERTEAFAIDSDVFEDYIGYVLYEEDLFL